MLTDLGTPDSRYAFEGEAGFIKTGGNQDPEWDGYPVVAGATCLNAARGGCMGGTLEIAASSVAWPALEQDQIVEFYWDRHDPASKFYRGRIARGLEIEGTGLVHAYQLSGAWALLNQINIGAVHKLGFDEGAPSSGTVNGCALYIIANIMGIAGVDGSRDFTYVGGIAGSTAPVKALTITMDSKLAEVFETLEFIARGADTADPTIAPGMGYYAAGAGQHGDLYLKRLDEDSVVLTVKAGNDHAYRPLANWRERKITRWRIGQLRTWGGYIQSGANAGRVGNTLRTNPYTEVGERARMAPHDVFFEGLDSGDDFALAATGWFKAFGRRVSFLASFDYVADAPPRPWEGFVKYYSKNEAGTWVEQKRFWDTAKFDMKRGAVVEASVGDEIEPRFSCNQGWGATRNMFEELSGVRRLRLATYPHVTRESGPDGPVAGGGSVADTMQIDVQGWPIDAI